MSVNDTLRKELIELGGERGRTDMRLRTLPGLVKEAREEESTNRANSLLQLAQKGQQLAGGAGAQSQPAPQQAPLPPLVQRGGGGGDPLSLVGAATGQAIEALGGPGAGIGGPATTSGSGRQLFDQSGRIRAEQTTTTNRPMSGLSFRGFPFGDILGLLGMRQETTTTTRADVADKAGIDEQANAVAQMRLDVDKGRADPRQLAATLQETTTRLGSGAEGRQAIQAGITRYRALKTLSDAADRKLAGERQVALAEAGIPRAAAAEVIKQEIFGDPESIARAWSEVPELDVTRLNRLERESVRALIAQRESAANKNDLELRRQLFGIEKRGIWAALFADPREGDLTQNQALSQIQRVIKDGDFSQAAMGALHASQAALFKRDGTMVLVSSRLVRGDKSRTVRGQVYLEHMMTMRGRRPLDKDGNLALDSASVDEPRSIAAQEESADALRDIGFMVTREPNDETGEIDWIVGVPDGDPNGPLLALLEGAHRDHIKLENSKGRVLNDFSEGGPLNPFKEVAPVVAEQVPAPPPTPASPQPAETPEERGRADARRLKGAVREVAGGTQAKKDAVAKLVTGAFERVAQRNAEAREQGIQRGRELPAEHRAFLNELLGR